ncbi:hypothetical protein NKR19_g9520 [Coniochaeta hoffmannii]|uniref:Aminoglycoside phosphotransferase domain-containing protein n=1 Tax=Coniochaeta hoffmannii TaxID=91930 RepID=A0AA38VBB2_9PEZI|nr:hypothetical protein NKR19_g9520 [Coniochaeta hoffmannii]
MSLSLPKITDDSDAAVVALFGPLVSIREPALVDVATRHVAIHFQHPDSWSRLAALTPGRVLYRAIGSYNLVHVIELHDATRVCIRVPATGWGRGLSGDDFATAARAMTSQVATLCLIASETTVPVPVIYGYDTSADNKIGAPYMCTSFLPGQSVARVWWGSEDDENELRERREKRRRRILRSVAHASAQLRKFKFAQIGPLHRQNECSGGGYGQLAVGSCFSFEHRDDGSLRVVDSGGPYDTLEAYLAQRFARSEFSPSSSDADPWEVAQRKVMDVVAPLLPRADGAGGGGFVLGIPDFDSQNVLVDHSGNVTGMIDWDLVQTVPPCVGFVRYPAWITRDWDPLMYWWHAGVPGEDSPTQLASYRRIYEAALSSELKGKKAAADCRRLARKAHVWEAVWIALHHPVNRLEICCKLVAEAVGKGDDLDEGRRILFEVGVGEADWEVVQNGLENLMRLEDRTDWLKNTPRRFCSVM